MILILAASLAFSEPKLPVSCDQIRALVAEHGRVKAIVWAREHGYSWAMIAEARKCLR